MNVCVVSILSLWVWGMKWLSCPEGMIVDRWYYNGFDMKKLEEWAESSYEKVKGSLKLAWKWE